MPLHALNAAMFSSEGMNHLFSAEATIQRMLDVEAALARALASEDVIPAACVEPWVRCCDARLFDTDALAQSARSAGNLAIPLVRQLTAQVSRVDAEAARYVHWGATSQDVIDTALVLQLRDATELITTGVAELADALAALAHKHRDTPMMGRTWMQHALPISFGLKAAGWLDAVMRHQQRLDEMRARLFVLQFGGATGTLASLGDRGLTVAQALARELDLSLPAMPWHAHRDRVAECATVLGLLTGTLGKIARDISLMSQTEVAELSEPVAAGRGGSSTLPHKRNPVGCAATLAAATRVPALVSTMLSGMPNEHERALGGWQAEWDTLPEIAALCAAALTQMSEVVQGLKVDAVRMRANIEVTQGLVMAEAVALALASQIGRAQAHDIVEAACHTALSERRTLLQVLQSDTIVSSALSADRLAALFDPLAYLGEAASFVDRVLAAHHRRKS
jgi:3-carboxy-cis,cis-muconate cycloisomerase